MPNSEFRKGASHGPSPIPAENADLIAAVKTRDRRFLRKWITSTVLTTIPTIVGCKTPLCAVCGHLDDDGKGECRGCGCSLIPLPKE